MAQLRPRIFAISHDAGRTGAPIGLLAFLRWLRANTACELSILLRTPGPLEASFRELGPTTTLGTSVFARTKLGRRIRRFLPRGVQLERSKVERAFSEAPCHAIYSNTVMNGAVLGLVSGRGVPVLTHVHELAYWIGRAGREEFQQVLNQSHRFVAVARAVRDHLVGQHGVPPDKVPVIYEHIRELPLLPSTEAKEAARARLGIPADAFVVGGCGAEHWRKGRDLIPQLLATLRKLCAPRDVHFIWVGRPGNADEEYALRHDLRLAGVCRHFHASGEVADPFGLFAAFDGFALLSREDPYPLACLEVAATEVPVVCFSGAGGMPEFVEDGCGAAVPYLDVEAMARRFREFAADPVQAKAIGARARAKVARENLVEATGPQIWAVLSELLSAVPARG